MPTISSTRELDSGFPGEWQGSNYLSHHCGLSECALTGSWNQKQSRTQAQALQCGVVGVPGTVLMAVPNACPLFDFVNLNLSSPMAAITNASDVYPFCSSL